MTPDERQMLSGLFDRVRSAANGPRDQEADAFIADAMRSNPGAAYVLSQTVLVQQQALEAATRRISDLETQVRSGGQGQPESGGFLGNLGRSLFGGGAQTPAPVSRSYDARAYENPPQGYGQQRAQYAPPPPPQGGPWGGGAAAAPQGSGFLGGALQTATGVAGGMLAANAIEGLLGGHRGGGGLFGGGGGFGGPSEVVNNYYGSDPAGQHAQDVLQDQDQDQDVAQDAADYNSDNSGGGGGSDDWT